MTFLLGVVVGVVVGCVALIGFVALGADAVERSSHSDRRG